MTTICTVDFLLKSHLEETPSYLNWNLSPLKEHFHLSKHPITGTFTFFFFAPLLKEALSAANNIQNDNKIQLLKYS